jgi:Ser/Thr protein kinase RdoA (MazF antagonist)
LIHGDFELDNLIWDGEQFQILDFDDASYAPFLADVAFAVADIWFGENARRPERLAAFLEGYSEIMLLPNDIVDSVGRFLNLLLAVKIARVRRAYSTTPSDNDPTWLTGMERYHQRWLAAKRALLKLS